MHRLLRVEGEVCREDGLLCSVSTCRLRAEVLASIAVDWGERVGQLAGDAPDLSWFAPRCLPSFGISGEGGAWIARRLAHPDGPAPAIEDGGGVVEACGAAGGEDDAPVLAIAGDGGTYAGGSAAPAADDGDGRAQWRARQREQVEYRKSASLWLFTDTPLQDMVLVRQVLGPMAFVMDSYLAQAGAAWGRRQIAACVAAFARPGCESMDGFGLRSYRTHLLLSGEVTSRGWTELLSVVRDSKRWDLLPPEFKPHGS